MIKKENASEMTASKKIGSSEALVADNQLGSVFQKTRLGKKLSVEDIANAIHLSEKQILALENHDFNALPEPMITRGFIRNYANYLDINSEPLLQRYRSLVPDQALRSIVVKANVNEVMSHHAQQPWLLYILGSILVLLFLMAWYYYMDSVNAPNAASPTAKIAIFESQDNTNTTTEIISNEMPLSPNLSDATSTQSEVPFVSSDNLPNANNPVEPTNPIKPTVPIDIQKTIDNQKSSTLSQSSLSQPPAASVAKPTLPFSKKLEMQFTAQSWVQVKNKAGQVLLEKTVAAGSVEALDGEQPFNIIIGNAAAAKVKYYGQDVDLTSSTSKNIIRLKLE